VFGLGAISCKNAQTMEVNVTMARKRGTGLITLIVFVSFMAGVCLQASGEVPGETKEERDARMGWWREARFGMFIHWGLYAIPAGVWNGKHIPSAGEWIMFGGKIPVEEYGPLLEQFNPVKFDAEAWVRIAKDAGMKYIVITSKHHDGFCLFDSKLTDYDVISTPFKRDIMKKLSDACHREGIKICWYHSVLDWHHPDYLPRGEGSPRPWDKRPTEGASYDRYIEHMEGQLRELVTNYGEIGVLWFDGGWEHSPEEHHAEEVVAMLRELQPSIIINNRIRLPQDFDTPEQTIPATGIPGRDWETCMTMNDTWGYKKHDRHWKSSEDLIRKLVDIASKGGNFLLNVGPTAEGLIPEPSVERLAAMGAWMKVNSEAIYGTTASPFKKLPWGRCTQKPGKLYLHVFNWPKEGQLEVPGLRNEVQKAYLLGDAGRAPLKVTRGAEAVLVAVPGKAPDPIASVVVLEIEGKPDVVITPILQSDDGIVNLSAADADVHGTSIQCESRHGQVILRRWTDAKDWASWDFRVNNPGTFVVEIALACSEKSAGSEYTVAVGNAELTAMVQPTGGWADFVTQKPGTVELAEPGDYTMSVKPKTKPHRAVMNLRAVTLTPK